MQDTCNLASKKRCKIKTSVLAVRECECAVWVIFIDFILCIKLTDVAFIEYGFDF